MKSINTVPARPRACWEEAVARVGWNFLDPLAASPAFIDRSTRIAVAGGTFAGQMAELIAQAGYSVYATEPRPEGQPFFSAAYGAIYTPEQLRQLMARAFGEPEAAGSAEAIWEYRESPVFLDAFRPTAGRPCGDAQQVSADRKAHLAKVRELVQGAEVFFISLEQSEAWVARDGGLVFPLPPMVLKKSYDPHDFIPHNFSAAEMADSLRGFMEMVRGVNAGLKIILAVSPIPILMTSGPEHVLVANGYAKSALRAAAEEIGRQYPGVFYFPALEVITGSYAAAHFFQDDLRSISPGGLKWLFHLFLRHFTVAGAPEDQTGGEETLSIPEDICDDGIVELSR